MSLIAADIGVDKAFMVELTHGEATLDRYSGNDDTKVSRKANIAADEFRSAAIKGGYAAADIDALTSLTIPPRWQEIIAHIALEELSSGGIGRPDSIKEKADQMRKSLSYLAGGAETIDGMTRIAGGGGNVSSSRRSTRPRAFERPEPDATDDTNFNYRDEPI